MNDSDYEIRDRPLESDPGISIRIESGEGSFVIYDLEEDYILLEMSGDTVHSVATELSLPVLRELVEIAALEKSRDADRLRAREEADYVMELNARGMLPSEISSQTGLHEELVLWIIRERGGTPNYWTRSI